MRHLNPLDGAGYFFPLHGLIVRESLTYAVSKVHPSSERNCIGVCYYHRRYQYWLKSGKECRAFYNFLKVVEV